MIGLRSVSQYAVEAWGRVHAMNDTVRIKRPLCCRRQQNLGGRTTQDLLGNSVKVRTRAQESPDDFDGSIFEHTIDWEKGSED
jgi:hypothetical protein